MVGFVWKEDGSWMAVLPPDAEAPIWHHWLTRQDARLRKRKTTPEGSYWLVRPALLEGVKERFIVAGWVIEYKNPFTDPTASSYRQDKQASTQSRKVPVDHYRSMFLLPYAPKGVVDAVYKALVKEVHPDRCENGEEKTKSLNECREAIYKQRGW